MMPDRPCLRGLSVSLFLLVGLFAYQGASSQEDLEREFFEGMGEMEKEYKDFEQTAFEKFQREVRAMWPDFVVSTEKDWVEYSGDKTGRTRVDFEKGEVQVEVLVPKGQAEKEPALVTERLSLEIERLVQDRGKNRDYPLPAPPRPKEPAPVPAPPTEIPPAPLLPRPVLEGQLQTKSGQPVTRDNEKEFVREILETAPREEEALKTEEGDMVKAKVTFALVPDHLRIRAEKYLASVRSQSSRFDIGVPLAFSVIHTESYFNPKARSPAPAFGLMQLVPRSGARDAYRFVYGEDKIPSPDYLYVPENNVELGCAYLGLLKNRYFKNVKNPESALYCAVASYNTGPGNLSRAFVGQPRLEPAIDRVNTMDPEEVFTHLRANLPYEETREYIQRVRDRMRLYKEWE